MICVMILGLRGMIFCCFFHVRVWLVLIICIDIFSLVVLKAKNGATAHDVLQYIVLFINFTYDFYGRDMNFPGLLFCEAPQTRPTSSLLNRRFMAI